MKKLIIISSLLWCFSNIIKAQDNIVVKEREEVRDSRNKLHIGLKIGLNNSNVYDSRGEDFNTTPKLGFVGGAFLSIPIGKYLGLHPEVLYSQKGFYSKGTFEGTTYNLSRTTSYMDVPVMLEFKPSRFITILGGPEYSYLLAQTDVFSKSSITAVQEQEFTNNNIRKNTLGAIFGVDLNLGHFVVGARYAFDMQTNNGDGSSTVPRYKNEWIQGTVGFRF